MTPINVRSLLLFSAVFRVILILYGEWQDTHMKVSYTDVDYLVFSDAASLIVLGDSPYKRTKYRYSPLLAFLLIPNSVIHRSWGKFIFSTSDLLVGVFMNTTLKQGKVPQNLCTWSVMVKLYKPRFGMGLLYIFGLSYYLCTSYYSVLALQFFRYGQKPVLSNWTHQQGKSLQSNTEANDSYNIWHMLRNVFTRRRIMFGMISGATFLCFTGIFFYLYGWEFLHEALLYHLTRTDPRHNFSISFYHIYLHYEQDLSVVDKLISFLPQIVVQLVLIFCFAHDLPFCLFVQTVAFVAFNKVITAQYFVWFFRLLSLILPWSNMKLKWEGLWCILIWMGAQTHWLLWGYMLEFKGRNAFLQLWMASLGFLAANTFLLIIIIHRHRCCPLFKSLNLGHSKEAIKME